MGGTEFTKFQLIVANFTFAGTHCSLAQYTRHVKYYEALSDWEFHDHHHSSRAIHQPSIVTTATVLDITSFPGIYLLELLPLLFVELEPLAITMAESSRDESAHNRTYDGDQSIDRMMAEDISMQDDRVRFCECHSTCMTKRCPCKEADTNCTQYCRCGTKKQRCNNDKPVSINYTFLHALSSRPYLLTQF